MTIIKLTDEERLMLLNIFDWLGQYTGLTEPGEGMNNPAAFPVVGLKQQGMTAFMDVSSVGMTLRDYFSAKIAAAICSSADNMKAVNPDGLFPPSVIAQTAYAFADALLAERNKQPSIPTPKHSESE